MSATRTNDIIEVIPAVVSGNSWQDWEKADREMQSQLRPGEMVGRSHERDSKFYYIVYAVRKPEPPVR